MAFNKDAYWPDLEGNSIQIRPKHPRTIRSYVRREGRLTSGQQHALDTLMPLYGLQADSSPVDFKEIFGRSAPITLEIGFGNGDSLLTMAEKDPETDFLGIEVHRPGVGHLLKGVHEKRLLNVRVICEDAATILKNNIPDNSLHRILLLFPDPWPKKRHHKRRFVQPASVAQLAGKLRPNGILHMATDWQEYAEHMLTVLSASDELENLSPARAYHQRPDYRLHTRFEQRGIRLGHKVYDLIFRRSTP